MAVRIGHASIDEDKKIRGGAAGDQNGKEVCVRDWYKGGWEFLARAKDRNVAEKIAAACEAGCVNPNIGYDQNQRNSLNLQAREVGYDLDKIETKCETDCSAFVSVCVRAAGIAISYTGSNAPTTSTLKQALKNTGAFDIFTDSKLLNSSDYLRRGDILVRPGKHTVMVLDDGARENVSVYLPVLQKGRKGESVRVLQMLLIGNGFDCGKSGVDGDFGSATERAVKQYQTVHNLTVDGSVGKKTWSSFLGIG